MVNHEENKLKMQERVRMRRTMALQLLRNPIMSYGMVLVMNLAGLDVFWVL